MERLNRRDGAIDHYASGRGWLAYYHSGLSGVVFWGHIDRASTEELSALIPMRFAPNVRPHPSIIDVRRVESIDPSALAVRSRVLEVNRATAGKFVTRCAIIHDKGVMGALSIGMRALEASPFTDAFFTDPVEALRWLGREDQVPVLAELDRLRAEVSGEPKVVRELRSLLDADPRLPLGKVARKLAVSSRSLQRALSAAGTSYQAEVGSATVRAAQRLLLEDGATVTSVAFELKCSSPQHLSTLFRSVVGETPTVWRARQLAR